MHKSLRWFIVFSRMSQFSDNCDAATWQVVFGDASFENPASRHFPRWFDHEKTTSPFSQFYMMKFVLAAIFIDVRL